ncbi:hypothetical protein GGER_25800 [Serratia rubidaea]
MNSWRDALSVDILPKNIVRDYGINGFSGKLRGERNGLMSALLIAQDMLNSDLSDNVIICGHFRSIPVLVFSEMQRYARPRGGAQGNSQASVERVGCLILKKPPRAAPGCTSAATCGCRTLRVRPRAVWRTAGCSTAAPIPVRCWALRRRPARCASCSSGRSSACPPRWAIRR